jgi:hypothetical protein
MDTVTVIVPLTRSHELERVVGCFRSQTYAARRLWIIENGPAVGTCRSIGWAPDLVLTSEPSAAAARNEAIAELGRRGGGWWASWDDDDWYGPRYLQEMMVAREHGDVVVKQHHMMCCSERLLLANERYANRLVRRGSGGALLARAEDSIEFERVKLNEDLRWTVAMADLGAKLWNSSIYHYLHRRVPGQQQLTGELSLSQLVYLHRGAWDLGPVDLDVVQGDREPPQRVWLERYSGGLSAKPERMIA